MGEMMKCPIKMCDRDYDPDDENCIINLEDGSTMGACFGHAITVYQCQGCYADIPGNNLLCEDCLKAEGEVETCYNCGFSFGRAYSDDCNLCRICLDDEY